MKSIATLILAAAFVVPAYSQTKLDSGVILPKKHEDKKTDTKSKETAKAEKAPKSDKKAAKK
jgi:hypothetical protein